MVELKPEDTGFVFTLFKQREFNKQTPDEQKLVIESARRIAQQEGLCGGVLCTQCCFGDNYFEQQCRAFITKTNRAKGAKELYHFLVGGGNNIGSCHVCSKRKVIVVEV